MSITKVLKRDKGTAQFENALCLQGHWEATVDEN